MALEKVLMDKHMALEHPVIVLTFRVLIPRDNHVDLSSIFFLDIDFEKRLGIWLTANDTSQLDHLSNTA